MLMLLLLIPFALVAVFWGWEFLRRCGVIGGCLATIVSGSCLGHPFFHVSVITLDRLMLVVVAGMYFMNRSLFGLKARALKSCDWVLVVFTAFMVGNTFTHDWKYGGGQSVSTLLFFYLMPVAVYWLASRCEFGERAQMAVLVTFSLFGIYLTLTAVCEVLGIRALVFPRYIMSVEHEEFLGRGRGPFLNPVGNGMYLSASLFCTLMLWDKVYKAHRPLVLLVAAFIGGGAFLTLTRSVWLGVAASFVALAVMLVPKPHRMRVLLCAAIAGGVLLFVAKPALSKFKRDKNVSAEEMSKSAQLRPILAAFAYEMFKDYPLTGVGLSQYKRYNLEYLTTREFDLPMEVAKTYVQHNIFLSLLVEAGLIGLSLFCGMLLVFIATGWSLWHATELPLWRRQFGLILVMLMAAYLPNGMFHELSVIPMLNVLVFFFAGLCRNATDSPAVAAASAINYHGRKSMGVV